MNRFFPHSGQLHHDSFCVSGSGLLISSTVYSSTDISVPSFGIANGNLNRSGSASCFDHRTRSFGIVLSVTVSVTVYSYTIDFKIEGNVYNQNTSLNASDLSSMKIAVTNRIQTKQRKVLDRARSELAAVLAKNPSAGSAIGYNITAKIGSIDM